MNRNWNRGIWLGLAVWAITLPAGRASAQHHEWGEAKPWQWAAGIGNSWRTTGDIADKWQGGRKWPDGR